MDTPNKRLQAVFMFQPTDLRANRGGRLSRRQQTVLEAAKSTNWLAMAVFALVMVGTGGIIVFSVVQTPGGPGQPAGSGGAASNMLVSAGFLLAALLVVVVIGFAVSRKYIAAFNTRQISVAQGRAAVAANQENNWRVKIGATTIRLAAPMQLEAFHPGIEYRVYYLAGPVPNILSAEVAGTEPDAAEEALEPAEPVARDPTLQVARGARLVLILLGLLALEIPIVAFWSAGLPESARWLVIGALLVEAIGFVGFALWRLVRRP